MPKTSKFFAVLTIVGATFGVAGPALAASDHLASDTRTGTDIGALGDGRMSAGFGTNSGPLGIGALGDGRAVAGTDSMGINIGALGDG